MYKKVFQLPAVSGTTWTLVKIFVNQASTIKVKKYEAFYYDSNNTLYMVPYANAYTNGVGLQGILQGDGNWVIKQATDYSLTGGWLFYEYTKTTD